MLVLLVVALGSVFAFRSSARVSFGTRRNVVLFAGFGAPRTAGPPATKKKKVCPCDSGKAFAACCGPLVARTEVADSALALLRARYAAFAANDVNFLSETTYARLPVKDHIAKGIAQTRFTRLEVLEETQIDDDTVDLLFRATMQPHSQKGQGPKALTVAERARFIRHNETWFYLNGTDISTEALSQGVKAPPPKAGPEVEGAERS